LYDYVVGERLVARGELGVSRGVAVAAQHLFNDVPAVQKLDGCRIRERGDLLPVDRKILNFHLLTLKRRSARGLDS
jgi:hypothetical protein